jgi:hypothetical protein
MMIMVGLLLVAVLAVLVMGIYNLARGGDGSEKRSNQLMIWRVCLQGGVVAILVIMFLVSGK